MAAPQIVRNPSSLQSPPGHQDVALRPAAGEWYGRRDEKRDALFILKRLQVLFTSHWPEHSLMALAPIVSTGAEVSSFIQRAVSPAQTRAFLLSQMSSHQKFTKLLIFLFCPLISRLVSSVSWAYRSWGRQPNSDLSVLLFKGSISGFGECWN